MHYLIFYVILKMIPRMGISNVIIINYKNLKERKEKQMRKIIINNIRNIGRLEFESKCSNMGTIK